MKIRYISIYSALLLLFGTGGAFAQDRDALERLYGNVASSCVETSYTFATLVSGLKVQGNHTLEVQDKYWHLEGGGLEIWCDGETVWTVDAAAKEVVIEGAGQNEGGFLTNPALLLLGMEEWFNVAQKSNSADGKSVVYSLTSKSDADTGIEKIDMELRKSDASLKKGSFVLEDGNKVTLTFTSTEVKEKRPVSYYRPSQIFDSSWIITDLR